MEIKKYTDLHTHTTFSDGTFTPEELIIKAKEIKLASVAITDHDTVDGIPDALEAGKKHGLKVVAFLIFLCTPYRCRRKHLFRSSCP